MTALPTSLRRTLLVLLGFMVTIIMMAFYWNQNATRVPSALTNTFLLPVERHELMFASFLYIFFMKWPTIFIFCFYFLRSPEKSWTYTCVNDKCVRGHYQAGEKRIPFMSCAMVCGSLNVWPLPTIKASLSSRSLRFQTFQMKFDVKTEFDDAKELLQNAYHIFLFDLKSLEEKATTASSRSSSSGSGASISSSKGTANTDNEQLRNRNKNAEPTLPTETKDINRNCDINKIVINAEILNAPDVYVHIDVDESYELNVTRKLNTHTFSIFIHLLWCARCRRLNIDSFSSRFFPFVLVLSIECRRQRYIESSHQSEFIFRCSSRFIDFAAIDLVR